MSSCADFFKISVEGIVGGGCNAFMWDVLEYSDGEAVWSGLEDQNVFDGDWLLGHWSKELKERYNAWEFSGVNNDEVDFVCFERSIWSFMVYALWNFRLALPRSIDIEEYRTLKVLFETLTEGVDLPDAIIYFECLPKKSPLPNEQFWLLDELYETWLSVMETNGVIVVRVSTQSSVGLGQEYFTSKLIQEVLMRINANRL